MKEKILYGIMAGLVFGNVASWMFLPKPQSFGVIDVQHLITERAQTLAKAKKANPRQVQEVADQLKEELRSFAMDKAVILLLKGAVVGGDLPDWTDRFVNEGGNP